MKARRTYGGKRYQRTTVEHETRSNVCRVEMRFFCAFTRNRFVACRFCFHQNQQSAAAVFIRRLCKFILSASHS